MREQHSQHFGISSTSHEEGKQNRSRRCGIGIIREEASELDQWRMYDVGRVQWLGMVLVVELKLPFELLVARGQATHAGSAGRPPR